MSAVGVVLAGGAGRRFGGGKAMARLGGRTLVERVADVMRTVAEDVVVCARADTALPALDASVPVWRESIDAPRHPLFGIAEALRRAGGRSVLVCAVDLPFVSPATLRRLLDADGELAVLQGQPLVGRYPPAAGAALAAAAREGRPARATVAELGPTVVAVADPAHELFNVNTVEDLVRAEARLGSGG